jgi:hypothetical protein
LFEPGIEVLAGKIVARFATGTENCMKNIKTKSRKK